VVLGAGKARKAHESGFLFVFQSDAAVVRAPYCTPKRVGTKQKLVKKSDVWPIFEPLQPLSRPICPAWHQKSDF
jgi:hypothetical protein